MNRIDSKSICNQTAELIQQIDDYVDKHDKPRSGFKDVPFRITALISVQKDRVLKNKYDLGPYVVGAKGITQTGSTVEEAVGKLQNDLFGTGTTVEKMYTESEIREAFNKTFTGHIRKRREYVDFLVCLKKGE